VAAVLAAVQKKVGSLKQELAKALSPPPVHREHEEPAADKISNILQVIKEQDALRTGKESFKHELARDSFKHELARISHAQMLRNSNSSVDTPSQLPLSNIKDKAHCLFPDVWVDNSCRSSPRGRADAAQQEAKACAGGTDSSACKQFKTNEVRIFARSPILRQKDARQRAWACLANSLWSHLTALQMPLETPAAGLFLCGHGLPVQPPAAGGTGHDLENLWKICGRSGCAFSWCLLSASLTHALKPNRRGRRSLSTIVIWKRTEATNTRRTKGATKSTKHRHLQARRIREADKDETQKVETHKVETQKVETQKVETHKVETQKVETQKVETQKVETDKVETQKVETQKVETDKVETQKVETQKVETQKVETDTADVAMAHGARAAQRMAMEWAA
jgi:hypothetical protein